MIEWVSIVDLASDWNWNRRVCHLSQSKQVENRCIVTVWKHHLSLRERVKQVGKWLIIPPKMHKNSPFWYQKPKIFWGGTPHPPRRLRRLGTSRLRRSTSAPQVLPPSYAYVQPIAELSQIGLNCPNWPSVCWSTTSQESHSNTFGVLIRYAISN